MIIKNCSDKELVYSLTQINEANYDKNKLLSDKFSVSEIISIIDKLAYYTTQIKDTTNKYLWLELCIIDVTNYKNLPSCENLMKRIEALEAKLASGAFIQNQNIPIANTPKQVSQTDIAIQQQRKETPITPPKTDDKTRIEPIKPIEQPVKTNVQQTKKEEIKPPQGVNPDLHNTWVSVVQSLSNPTAKGYYEKARPVELSEKRILIAFPNDLFVKMADKNKKQALSDAITSYLGIKNPNIEIILTKDIPNDAVNTVEVPKTPAPAPIQDEPVDIQKEEEEAYQTYVESQQENPQKIEKPVDMSSQANMVKDLFGGKIIE